MFTEDKPQNHSQYLPSGYRKKTVIVSKVKAPYQKSIDTDWSGGLRSYYALYKQGKGTGESVGGGSFGWRETPKITLEAGDVLVESGIFCGKPMRAHIIYCEA
jgi:hypothetical protein